uniref:Uncharacterized protein n=1 Tax=Globodera rostochiensis TaxID=31243 RepID=A0A914IBE6_GLORO
MNSFYWAKTAFVSLLMISSITFEATCSGPVSESFNSLIVGITSANEGEHSAASISNQRPLELKLADAQMLQQWIGQIARKFVVEDGIFAGNYFISDFVIGAVIKSPIEQLKVDKIILKKNNRRHIQELALLNSSKTEMTPTDVINFAYFITTQFLKFSPTDSFESIFQWTKWGPSFGTLRISSFGEDLIKYRRIAHQLLLDLKNCGPEELEEFSLKKSNEFSANNCKKEKENDGIENSKIYPFFDEAIRIDWNVWTEIIQQIDELTKTVKSMDTKQVAEYLKRANENEGPMKIVKAKFDEKKFGLELKADINVEAQLFELFFSFAARLEAIVHGKNIDGTIEESRENPKDKIRAFLAVPNCLNVQEWANKFSIFDYWMEIKEINSKESQKMPVIGVAIYKELFNEARSRLQKNYKMLKSLNEQKFSIYEERNGRKVEETKIALLNNVRYDLVINFKLNAWKDVRDRTAAQIYWEI